MKIRFRTSYAKGNQLFNNLTPKNKFPNDILLVLTSHQRKITLTLHCTIMNTAMDWNQIWTWSPSKIMFVKLSTNKNGHHGLLCILFGFSLKYSNKNSVPYLGKIKVNFVRQGHNTQFWKEMIHPNIIILNLFQFGPVVLEKKIKKNL
jgi:hypothetical protein